MPTESVRRLPFFRLVLEAFALWFTHIRVFFRAAFGWSAVATMALVLIVEIGTWAQFQAPQVGTLLLIGSTGTGACVLIVACAGALIAWHRYLQLDEKPDGGLDVGAARLRTNALRAVLLFAALFVLPVTAIVALSSIDPDGIDADAGIADYSLIVLAFVAHLVLLRLGIAFVATAVDDDRVSLKDAWALTRGFGWRIALGHLLIAVPVAFLLFVVLDALPILTMDLDRMIGLAIRMATIVAAVMIYAGLTATFMSLIYRSVMGKPGLNVEDVFA